MNKTEKKTMEKPKKNICKTSKSRVFFVFDSNDDDDDKQSYSVFHSKLVVWYFKFSMCFMDSVHIAFGVNV